MITGYASYTSYFRKLAWQHKALRASFYVGDSWVLIGAQRSDVVYPVMWLERPIIRPVFAPDGDSLRMRIEGAFSIVANAATDDYDKQEAMLAQCQVIASQIINRAKQDSDNNEFDLYVDTIRMDSLAVLMTDDLHGWRVEYSLQTNGWDDCVDATAWQLTDGEGAEFLPGEADYQPYVPGPSVAIDCDLTIPDFACVRDAGTLLLSDATTYADGDTRRSVSYVISDGLHTVTVEDFHRTLRADELSALSYSRDWVITMAVITRAGCEKTKSITLASTTPSVLRGLVDNSGAFLIDNSGATLTDNSF